MLVGSVPLAGAAALDAALTSDIVEWANAYAPAPDSPRHWSLDDVLWSPDEMAAAAAPPGADAGALRPAPLAAAAVREPKAAGRPRRRTQRSVTCMALGCGAALYALGGYYIRNRLCPAHVRAEQLQLTQEGAPLRFCQVREQRPAYG